VWRFELPVGCRPASRPGASREWESKTGPGRKDGASRWLGRSARCLFPDGSIDRMRRGNHWRRGESALFREDGSYASGCFVSRALALRLWLRARVTIRQGCVPRPRRPVSFLPSHLFSIFSYINIWACIKIWGPPKSWALCSQHSQHICPPGPVLEHMDH
jgi:hypothetical protein